VFHWYCVGDLFFCPWRSPQEHPACPKFAFCPECFHYISGNAFPALLVNFYSVQDVISLFSTSPFGVISPSNLRTHFALRRYPPPMALISVPQWGTGHPLVYTGYRSPLFPSPICKNVPMLTNLFPGVLDCASLFSPAPCQSKPPCIGTEFSAFLFCTFLENPPFPPAAPFDPTSLHPLMCPKDLPTHGHPPLESFHFGQDYRVTNFSLSLFEVH